MTITRAAAAATLSLGLLLGAGACTSDDAADESTTTVTSEGGVGDAATDDTSGPGDELDETDDTDDTDGADESGVDAAPADVASACEEFNTLSADLRAVTPGDTEGYDDLAERADAAERTAPTDELEDLFEVLEQVAREAGAGDDTSATMLTLGDAVFAAAGDCTAQDVTLTIS